MNIGNYLNYVLCSENIDKKNLYNKVKILMESTEGSYITYSRFCNKINSDTLTAKEFVFILSILGDRFNCNKFLQKIILEMPVEYDFLSPEKDIEMSKLREELDIWYDYELLFINDTKFDFYKTIPNVKLLDEKTSIINTIVKYIDNPSDGSQIEYIKTGVSEIYYLSYSFDTNELRLENVVFGTDFSECSHSPYPHIIGEKGHGGYCEVFYTNKFKKYLAINNMTYDDFDKKCFADKIKYIYDWLNTRNYLTEKKIEKYLEFDI